jgi:D-alanine-D-alanine ligase
VGEGVGLDPAAWFHGAGKHLLEALSGLRDSGLDIAFNALHGPMGEDGTIQGLFRMVGLPFTGPDVIPAAVTMDKRLTKQVLQAAGIPTPRFFALKASRVLDGSKDWVRVFQREAERLPFPWILKPNRLGSSVGVAIFDGIDRAVAGTPELVRRWPESAREEGLLVEEVVTGRELTCGVIETRAPAHALPPIEIRPRGQDFFNYEAKYTPGASEEICPAPLSPAETRSVQQTALAVHELLECAPLSRTDMFLLPDGRLEVLEVNTLPGMTATSLIPLSASKAGIPLCELLASIVEHGLSRATAAGCAKAWDELDPDPKSLGA